MDKVENPTPQDESRLTFNYSHVLEDLSEPYINLASKAHDYLSDPTHRIYMQADIKRDYFAVELNPDDREMFAFSILELGQVQPARMPQSSRTADFIMSELMNFTLDQMPVPKPEPSLIQPESPQEIAPIFPYADDLLGRHTSFERQYTFLEDHFLLRIEWAGLRLSFKKLKLAMSECYIWLISPDSHPTHAAGRGVQSSADTARSYLEVFEDRST